MATSSTATDAQPTSKRRPFVAPELTPREHLTRVTGDFNGTFFAS